MAATICHFAIHADDCERALAFYTAVFDWKFVPWGPPGFWRIDTGQQGLEGALQQRQEDASGGAPGSASGSSPGSVVRGYECSISVEDVDATCQAIEEHAGALTHPPVLIEGVGRVARFTDTEGNPVCVMQYLEGVVPGSFE